MKKLSRAKAAQKELKQAQAVADDKQEAVSKFVASQHVSQKEFNALMRQAQMLAEKL